MLVSGNRTNWPLFCSAQKPSQNETKTQADTQFKAAGKQIRDYLEKTGYTVAEFLKERSSGKDFAMQEDTGLLGKQYILWFHQDSTNAKERQRDYREAVEFLKKMPGIETVGQHSFKLNGTPIILIMQSPNRPSQNWVSYVKPSRFAKAEARVPQKPIPEKPVPHKPKPTPAPKPVPAPVKNGPTQAQVTAMRQFLKTEIEKLGVTVGWAQEAGAEKKTIQIQTTQGLHGTQLRIRNESRELTGRQRGDLDRKIRDHFKNLPGAKATTPTSYMMNNVFFNVWTPIPLPAAKP